MVTKTKRCHYIMYNQMPKHFQLMNSYTMQEAMKCLRKDLDNKVDKEIFMKSKWDLLLQQILKLDADQ